MLKIALIGAGGYIGSSLLENLKSNKEFRVTPVFRHNYEALKKNNFDIVINSAMPAARFWAKENPMDDFRETVEKTAKILYGWRYKKFVQISSISARTDKDSIYGKHKFMAETLCKNNENLILRLTATFDKTLKKGALIDIIEGKKVYVSKNSRYSFASLKFVSKWIATHLDETGIIELGAKNSVSLGEIAKSLRLVVNFNGPIDIQEAKDPRVEFPDANLVLDFLKEKLKAKS